MRAVDMLKTDNGCQERLEVKVGRFTCTRACVRLLSLRLC